MTNTKALRRELLPIVTVDRPQDENPDNQSHSSFSSLEIDLPPPVARGATFLPAMSAMSATRRTTRATSRAASSRGASPAIDEQDVPATPSRRSRRATSNTPLPQVGLRTSNSYGTNQLPQLASMRAPSGAGSIDHVMSGILDPVHRLDPVPEEGNGNTRGGRSVTSGSRVSRRGRRAPTETPDGADERSYQLESSIFDGANIESSSVADPGEHPGIPEYPNTPRPVPQSRAQVEREHGEYIAEIARRTRVNRGPEQAPGGIKWWFSQVPFNWKYAGILLALSLSVLYGGSLFSSAWSAVSNLPGKFGDTWSSPSPGGYYNTQDVTNLQRRMKTVESDIASLKKRAGLDEHAISILNEALPRQVVCKKDENGNLQIPDDFWQALQAKIRKDDSLIVGETDSKSAPKTGLSRKEVTNIAEKAISQSEKVWNKFLETNKERITQWGNDDFQVHVQKAIAKYSQTHDKVPKFDFIELLKKNWDDTQDEIQKQLRPLAKQLEDSLHHLQKIEAKTIGKDKVESIAHSVATKLISNVKLGAHASANINNNANAALLRVNHFSPGSGAAIDPYLTSPNFVFPQMDRSIIARAAHRLFGRPIPSPNPPVVALQRWEEFGDCWCSPSKDADGFGPSLSVLLGSNLQPDQIVVEHIAKSATLEPGTAPKEMELLAFIEDIPTYHKIRAESGAYFAYEVHGEPQLAPGWVRLGTWTYDAASSLTTQSFRMQIDLQSFDGAAFTNHVIVRAKNNWGGDKVNYTCLYRVRLNADVVHQEV